MTVIDIKFASGGHAVSSLRPSTTPEQAQKVVKAMFNSEAMLVRAERIYRLKND